MALKYENVVVDVEGFTIVEIDTEAQIQLHDKLREKYSELSDTAFVVRFTRELFVKRAQKWPINDPCNDDGKRVFYKSFPEKAKELLDKADEAIKKKREKLLGNLLGGASGT